MTTVDKYQRRQAVRKQVHAQLRADGVRISILSPEFINALIDSIIAEEDKDEAKLLPKCDLYMA